MIKRTWMRLGAVGSSLLLTVLVGTSSAHAATVTININRYATATSVIKKLNQSLTFAKTPFTGSLAFSGPTLPAPITATLALPPTSMTMKLGSLDLVTVAMSIVDASPVTGNATFSGDHWRYWHFDTQQSFRIQITRISPLGQNWINLVPSTCRTGMTTVHLSGGFDITQKGAGGPFDYMMNGSYSIPNFSGCGWLITPLLNTVVSGPGNTLAVHLTGS